MKTMLIHVLIIRIIDDMRVRLVSEYPWYKGELLA